MRSSLMLCNPKPPRRHNQLMGDHQDEGPMSETVSSYLEKRLRSEDEAPIVIRQNELQSVLAVLPEFCERAQPWKPSEA